MKSSIRFVLLSCVGILGVSPTTYAQPDKPRRIQFAHEFVRWAEERGRELPGLGGESSDGPRAGEASGRQTCSTGALAISRDGALVAAGDPSGQLEVWPCSADDKVASLLRVKTGVGAIKAVVFSPDATAVVVGGHRAVEVYSLKTGGLEQSWRGLPQNIVSLACDAAGRKLLAGSSVGTVFVLEVATGKVLHKLEQEQTPLRPDGVTFADQETVALVLRSNGEMDGWSPRFGVGGESSDLAKHVAMTVESLEREYLDRVPTAPVVADFDVDDRTFLYVKRATVTPLVKPTFSAVLSSDGYGMIVVNTRQVHVRVVQRHMEFDALKQADVEQELVDGIGNKARKGRRAMPAGIAFQQAPAESEKVLYDASEWKTRTQIFKIRQDVLPQGGSDKIPHQARMLALASDRGGLLYEVNGKVISDGLAADRSAKSLWGGRSTHSSWTLSASGRHAACLKDNRTVLVWDAYTGRIVNQLKIGE